MGVLKGEKTDLRSAAVLLNSYNTNQFLQGILIEIQCIDEAQMPKAKV